MTPELAVEGVSRDVIRTINQMRADADLELTQRIVVVYPEDDGNVTAAFRDYGDRIAAETLASELVAGAELGIEPA